MKLVDDAHRISQWVTERTKDGFPMGVAGAIGIERDDELRAGVVFDHYTPSCVTATIAIDGKYLPRQLLIAMFNYAFVYLDVGKIIVYVNESNVTSLRLAKQLGFWVEAEIKDVYQEFSMFILAMRRQDCAWIGEQHG